MGPCACGDITSAQSTSYFFGPGPPPDASQIIVIVNIERPLWREPPTVAVDRRYVYRARNEHGVYLLLGRKSMHGRRVGDEESFAILGGLLD
jgi:hypothetical protein